SRPCRGRGLQQPPPAARRGPTKPGEPFESLANGLLPKALRKRPEPVPARSVRAAHPARQELRIASYPAPIHHCAQEPKVCGREPSPEGATPRSCGRTPKDVGRCAANNQDVRPAFRETTSCHPPAPAEIR